MTQEDARRWCIDCVHFIRCQWLIQATAFSRECDWDPSRFKMRVKEEKDAAE